MVICVCNRKILYKIVKIALYFILKLVKMGFISKPSDIQYEYRDT